MVLRQFHQWFHTQLLWRQGLPSRLLSHQSALDDPWLAPLKVRCLEFLRSAPAQRRDCVLSWREQTNQVTSYIDASPIYSNSAKSSDNARVFRHGLLVYGRGDPAEDVCQRGAIATKCIRSGDGRSGEQPGLLAMHHVWVGEHNRIAMELSELNPHWSDEKVYQETRRIVGAMFQHITFREFLPVILGREVVKLFDLELMPSGYYERYSSKVNPTVANAFAAAAFRFGHSLVQNSYTRCDRHHNVINNSEFGAGLSHLRYLLLTLDILYKMSACMRSSSEVTLVRRAHCTVCYVAWPPKGL